MLILITGAMAAGKSTVAEALSRTFERSVHLRGDQFRRAIVRGRVDMSADPSEEAVAQLELRYRLAMAAARAYLAAGFTVVWQDIVIGAHLGRVVADCADLPLHVVVLCPSADVLAQREAGRAKTGYGAITVGALARAVREETPKVGLWLDTSRQTVEETVASISRRLPAARVSG